MKQRENFKLWEYVVFMLITFGVLILCVSIGSVSVPFKNTITIIWNTIFRLPIPNEISSPAIIYASRLPRVICVALVGASLSLCGGAMQGLLKNPLADGSTLGVSSGASLGAIIAIAFGITIPSLPLSGTILMAMLFAFISLLIILSLAYKLDYSLSTNTIILIGVIYSMFVSSIMSLIITFASDKVKHITFWTMGSLAGSSYQNALLLFITLIICSVIILSLSKELNAFAIGEENAMHIGVNIRGVKLLILITVSILIGVCVSIGGTIGFVGLVTPHVVRMIVGPNHKRLLPASLFGGAIFLMLADLISRILLNPLELPIGVVTSFIGSIIFVIIFYRTRSIQR
ncbi:MAG: iron ABC transporter permease [Erysipelotrichaceae bacterium]|jgi:iron complex transport system permease protein|nr:iron ABC transporter permease [Bacillota bacterium]